jgi:hypothetical protein
MTFQDSTFLSTISSANSSMLSPAENSVSNVLTYYNIQQAGDLLLKNFDSITPYINKNDKTFNLESSSRLYVQDLICEGPIFGLFDDLGNDLVLFDNAQNNEENLKGLYLNDVPAKNSVNNTLNFNRVSVFGKVGYEFQSSLSQPC